MFPRSEITGVTFTLGGSEDVEKDAYAYVTSSALLTDGKAQAGGFYDPHMGPTGINTRCAVCDETSEACKGHDGVLSLNQPTWHPMAVNECRKWLKLICFKCGQPFISIAKFAHCAAIQRLDAAQKFARTQTKRPCVECGEMHPVIKKDNAHIFALKYFLESNKADKKILLPHKIYEILDRVTDSTVVALGKPLTSHPRKYILTKVKIPSVIFRPDIKRIGGGKSSVDKLTAGYQTLYRKEIKLPAVLPSGQIGEKLESDIVDLSAFYYGLIRTNVDEGASIAQRLTGKKGRIRRNLLGKRVFNIGRDTIAGSSDVAVDEFAIPLKFAKILQVKEIVTAYNKARIISYVKAGSKFYPGASVVKKPNGGKYNVAMMVDNIEIGDVVYRDLIDGDIAEFNRQPSLRAANIQAHKVRIIRDPRVRVFLLNPTTVKVYDGDFDGDEMNVIVYASISSRIEIETLSAVPNNLVNYDNSIPVYGHIEDSIVGNANLTRSRVVCNRYAANWLYRNTACSPVITADTYTGREVLSLAFKETPINYRRASGFCNDTFKDYIKWDPQDKTIVITNGLIMSGIVDKKSTGSGSPNNIFHVVARDYSHKAALKVMHDTQQVGIAVNQFINMTLCVADLILPPWARQVCEEINTSQFVKSQVITERFKRGEIIPPIGKTTQQFYEELQIPALTPGDAFVDPVMRSVDWENNGYLTMIFAGSKGSFNNLYNMTTSVGLRTMNGKRPPMNFGYKRALPYTKRFDTDPASRGYVSNPYIRGLNGIEYYWNAWAARVDLILKQLFTSVSGKQARTSAINLEAIHTNYYRWSVKSAAIVNLMYGEDGMDPRRLVAVKFPTVMLSKKDFEAAYHHPDYPDFNAQLTQDRDRYRLIYTQLEKFSEVDVMVDERKMSIDVAHIITNTLSSMQNKQEPTAAEVKVMVNQIVAYCDDFAYHFTNEQQRVARAEIPTYLRAITWLPTMLIRSHLHPKALIANKMTPLQVTYILRRITRTYMEGLIEPGTAVGTIAATCFSAYLTQFIIDAHRRSATGGTSKTGMTLMSEILSAKPTEQLSQPTMLVPVLPEYATSEVLTKEIANTLEAMYFRRFVSTAAAFLEKYGAPVHPKYQHESADIALFDKLNPLLRPPTDLLNLCIRFALIPTELILKNISVETIVTKLRNEFPATYIMYTPENAKVLYLRVYCRSNMFRQNPTESQLADITNTMLGCLIRGINGIKEASVVKLHQSKINSDDSVSRQTEFWAIKTRGTNLVDVSLHPKVDRRFVMTEAVQELYNVYGIEVARHRIILGMKGIVEIDRRHYTMYADEMTWNGKITNIETSGMKARAPESVLMAAGASSPVQVLEHAALNGLKDQVKGLTAPLMMGTVPKMGTNYGRLVVNEEFVRANVKRAEDIFEAALI